MSRFGAMRSDKIREICLGGTMQLGDLARHLCSFTDLDPEQLEPSFATRETLPKRGSSSDPSLLKCQGSTESPPNTQGSLKLQAYTMNPYMVYEPQILNPTCYMNPKLPTRYWISAERSAAGIFRRYSRECMKAAASSSAQHLCKAISPLHICPPELASEMETCFDLSRFQLRCTCCDAPKKSLDPPGPACSSEA